ncbi:trypsin-like peptidase domain-containing protein [Streptomyces sp. NPDC057705]|uniref:nSTAND1 domain-containing NTPase n=1 Tax=Streptomyces sp. NPDC057705 TaxID=3346222 RepID=UPI0036B130EA
MKSTAGPTGEGNWDLLPAVAQIVGPDDQVAGAGFLVAENILVTCAHVVRAAGSGPGGTVRVDFPHVEGVPRAEGLVLDAPWRDPEDDDVAVVRLSGTSGTSGTRATPAAGVRGLPLGSASGSRGHQVRSFGFPAQAPAGGHFGFGVAGDLIPASENRGLYLQLTAANDLTTGFSGGPVVDEVTGLVIGMLTEITDPDDHERGQGIAYVTPTDVLREAWPDLTEQDVCPYRGLDSFTADEAQWFEGRTDAVRQVLASLAGHRVTLLLGPSGSGKSSLVQAGVLPALAAGRLPGSDMWLPVLVRPRQDLLNELERGGLPGVESDGIVAAVSHRLAVEPGRQRLLLIVDQFEELLTQPSTGRQRKRRLAATKQITTAVRSHARVSVLLIMRDDFYPQQAALAPKLLEAAMPGLLNIPGTLSEEDLYAIITRPAQNAGAHFERGLPEQIVSDVLATTAEGTTTRRAPVTVLPLLELALSQLWQRRHDGYLTHDAYRRIGGVTGSLTTWCDTALEQLPPDHHVIAQRILTSLVRPADPERNIPAVRAQVSLKELRDLADSVDGVVEQSDGGTGPEPSAARHKKREIDEVLAALTRHRIITTHTPRISPHHNTPPETPVAELIHDALIRDWGTLREWISQDHRFHEWLDQLRIRRVRYEEGKDAGDLLGGTALAEGLEWSAQRRLPSDIATFVNASKNHQQSAIRRSRRLNAVLATLLVLALGAVVGVFLQRQEAVSQRKEAESQRRVAVASRQEALSRALALQSNRLTRANPDLAALLAVQAFTTSHTSESKESLENLAALPLKRRLAHSGTVWRVAFSPDGKTLATAAGATSVILWNTDTGTIRSTLNGATGPVYAVAFSPDGKRLAASSTDTTVWDVHDGTILTTLKGHTKPVNSVAFSPDGTTLATGGEDKTARLWNADTGAPRATLTGHKDWIWEVAFRPDGKTLATGSNDHTVRLWNVDARTTRATLTGHTGPVYAVAFSPDGKALATGSEDKTARLWNVDTGRTRTTLTNHADMVTSAAFSPDGNTLATGSSDTSVLLSDVATGTSPTVLNGHTDTVFGMAFSPDGKTLATGSEDKTAQLWNVDTGRNRTILIGHTDTVGSVAFSPDGKTLATGSKDKTARLWNLATRTTRATLEGHTDMVNAVAFSPDGKILATGSDDHTARLWDVDTGTSLPPLRGHTGWVTSVAFSPDGKTLATGSRDSTVRLWNVDTRTSRALLEGHGDTVLDLAFSPDGETLASGSLDKEVRLWASGTGAPLGILKGHSRAVNAVHFSPDRRTLATGSGDHTVRLWDVKTHTVGAILTGHTGPVYVVVFSPDGKTLASGSNDNTVRLWDLDTRTTRATLTGHTGAVYAAAFSPDGTTLATGSYDNTVRLWHAEPLPHHKAIKKICEAVDRREFTQEEREAYLAGRSVDPVCPAP